jgi:hypothetical protein
MSGLLSPITALFNGLEIVVLEMLKSQTLAAWRQRNEDGGRKNSI